MTLTRLTTLNYKFIEREGGGGRGGGNKGGAGGLERGRNESRIFIRKTADDQTLMHEINGGTFSIVCYVRALAFAITRARAQTHTHKGDRGAGSCNTYSILSPKCIVVCNS